MSDSKEDVEKISLATRMKMYEKKSIILPYESFVVRVDGKCFKTFTEFFKKPFDKNFYDAMYLTAVDLLNEFKTTTVFFCSDEITLVFPALCTKEQYEEDPKRFYHDHSGIRSKYTSLVTALCSVSFNVHIKETINRNKEHYSDQFVNKINLSMPIFDARVIQFPYGSEFEVLNNLIWRSSYDCYRNCVSAYARSIFGHDKIKNKKSDAMIQMMKEQAGFDWDTEVPEYYKYGRIVKKQQYQATNEEGKSYTRHRVVDFTKNFLKENFQESLNMILSKYYTGDKSDSNNL
jgi:tRNA(His) 5'-end guanylyltransferase